MGLILGLLGMINPLKGVKQAVNLGWLLLALSAVGWLSWTVYSHVSEFNRRGILILEKDRVIETVTTQYVTSETRRKQEGQAYTNSLRQQEQSYLQLIASQKVQTDLALAQARRDAAAARHFQSIIEEARNAPPEDDAPAADVLGGVLDRLYGVAPGGGPAATDAAGAGH